MTVTPTVIDPDQREQTELESGEYAALNDGLTQLAQGAIWNSWRSRQECRGRLSRFKDYRDGRAGIPDIDDVSDELQTIARQCIINMIGVVVSTFDSGLSVVGYRSPSAVDNEPAWLRWQASGMDARQSEVHDAALTYGYSFASVLPDDTDGGLSHIATWSPMDVVADYDDPRRDLFPERAMLLRAVEGGWSVLLIDDTVVQPGFVTKRSKSKVCAADVQVTGGPWAHGATWKGVPVCPVVRFLNERSADDRPPRGEVEPLISKQRALNSVNFERLVNSRFNAFQQMVVIGWETTKQTLLKTSAARALAFEDHPSDLTVQKLSASPIEPYNALVLAMKEEFALEASIPIYTATGSISNVSTDTAAMVENAHQRKLNRKRDSFGESWEQVLRLCVVMDGGEDVSESAEVVWRTTEARSFAAVIDGIVKLASIPADAGGVPVEDLLDLIPGMTQPRVDSIRDGIIRRRSSGMLTTLQGMLDAGTGQAVPAATVAPPDESVSADILKAKFDALGVAIRAGVAPADAAARLGLDGIQFTGAVPSSLRLPATSAAILEGP